MTSCIIVVIMFLHLLLKGQCATCVNCKSRDFIEHNIKLHVMYILCHLLSIVSVMPHGHPVRYGI